MSLQQTLEAQQEHFEKTLKECAGVRKPPIPIAEISWTALRNLDGYSLGITIKGQDPAYPNRFSLPGFDLEQNGPYLRDIIHGWFSSIEKKSLSSLRAPHTELTAPRPAAAMGGTLR